MRVWLWQDNEYGEVGDRRWLVEWYTVTPSAKRRVESNAAAGKEDEYDYDRDIELNERAFPPKAKGLAVAYAKRMAGVQLSAFGSAQVKAQVVSDDEAPAGYGEWVDAGDAIDV